MAYSTPRRRTMWLLLLLLPIIAVIIIYQFPLWSIEQLIRFKFDVHHLSAQKLSEHLTEQSDQFIVFDVREPHEFQVSHLKDAIHINPECSAESFMAQFGERIANKDVVFYCSAGYRSSQFAERVKSLAQSANAGKIYNLEGGIFRWYNQGRPVYNEQGSTDQVHPYSDRFKGMLNSKRFEQP